MGRSVFCLARFHKIIEHVPSKMAQAPPNHPPPQPKVQCNLTGRMFFDNSPHFRCLKFGSSKGCIRIALDLCWNILNAHTFRFETHFRLFLLSFSRTFPIPPDPWPDPIHSPSTWFDKCQPDSAIYIYIYIYIPYTPHSYQLRLGYIYIIYILKCGSTCPKTYGRILANCEYDFLPLTISICWALGNPSLLSPKGVRQA